MKSVRLLLSIIEGRIDHDIFKNITLSLDDFEVIFERMNHVFKKFLQDELKLNPETATLAQIQNSLKKDSFEGDIQEGFDIFILVSSLADSYIDARRKIDAFRQSNYFQFFEANTGQIEILMGPDQIQRVYFPVRPVCSFLT